jgi:hypothetical protein
LATLASILDGIQSDRRARFEAGSLFVLNLLQVEKLQLAWRRDFALGEPYDRLNDGLNPESSDRRKVIVICLWICIAFV